MKSTIKSKVKRNKNQSTIPNLTLGSIYEETNIECKAKGKTKIQKYNRRNWNWNLCVVGGSKEIFGIKTCVP